MNWDTVPAEALPPPNEKYLREKYLLVPRMKTLLTIAALLGAFVTGMGITYLKARDAAVQAVSARLGDRAVEDVLRVLDEIETRAAELRSDPYLARLDRLENNRVQIGEIPFPPPSAAHRDVASRRSIVIKFPRQFKDTPKVHVAVSSFNFIGDQLNLGPRCLVYVEKGSESATGFTATIETWQQVPAGKSDAVTAIYFAVGDP